MTLFGIEDDPAFPDWMGDEPIYAPDKTLLEGIVPDVYDAEYEKGVPPGSSFLKS